MAYDPYIIPDEHKVALDTRYLKRSEYSVAGIEALRQQVDDFIGDSVDARWNWTLVGTATAPALQNTSPHRVQLATGATLNSTGELNHNSLFGFAVADLVTISARVKYATATTITSYPISLENSGATQWIRAVFKDTAAEPNGYYLEVKDGTTTTKVSSNVAVDANWHIYTLSIQPTSVKFTLDKTTVMEVTTHIPTVDMQFRSFIQNTSGANRTMEIDYIIFAAGQAF